MSHFLSVICPVLFHTRLLSGYHVQDSNALVLTFNDHHVKNATQETLLKPDDPWISDKKDNRPHVLKHLNAINYLNANTSPHPLPVIIPIYTTCSCLKISHIAFKDSLSMSLTHNVQQH